jgi:hypothetical protein
MSSLDWYIENASAPAAMAVVMMKPTIPSHEGTDLPLSPAMTFLPISGHHAECLGDGYENLGVTSVRTLHLPRRLPKICSYPD